MKYLFILLIGFLPYACVYQEGRTQTKVRQDESLSIDKEGWRSDTDFIMNWSFIDVSQIVLSEFPEAYEDLMNVSFIRIDERISPVTAEFLIPTIALNEIDSLEIRRRIGRILTKMGDPPSCEKFRIGEATTYSWAQWEDKNVTVLYIDFLIGC